MPNKTVQILGESLNIIWTIASKDIVDALKNRVILSMIITLIIMLLIPKLLPSIFEQTQMVVPVYDQDNAAWLEEIKSNSDLLIRQVYSEEELRRSLCGALYPEIGLVLPDNYDPRLDGAEPVMLQGFVCWSKRHQVSAVQPTLEEMLSKSLGKPVQLKIQGNFLYPPTEGISYLSLTTVNSIVLILVIGIFMVPSLLFEEKETKTMQALLVSPASIAQVVVGKALAGLFYILVSASVIFLITWVDVIHWGLVLLFVIGSGVFSVAVGLVLGSSFEKSQDVVGWMSAILLVLIGAVLIKALGVELPSLAGTLINLIPSVSLAEIYHGALSESADLPKVWTNFGIVLTISLLFYALVTVIVKRQALR